MTPARFLTPVLGTVAAVGLVLTSAAVPAVAQSDEPVVTNRETVQAFLKSDGELDVARVYDQIDAYGTGEVTLENPVSTQGLRNLDGFGRPEVQDGVAIQSLDVDGEARLRTVSDFDGELPVTITPRYRLDGEVVDAGDLVGASGTVEVSYTVENITGEPTEVTFNDGRGDEVTRTVDVPIPMVGQLVTVLPGSFTEVRSGEATVSGDGRGGTRLSFTMTLFPPIGSTTAEFAWTAQTSDGSLPPATVSVAPVRPLESPSFRGAAESYQGGAETGVRLTDGATEIDTNLLRLRDGAAELLDGIVQLRDGADQLRAGLQDTAAPGARELADGADQAAAGADELATGLSGTAAPGARQLAEGAELAASGAEALASGLGQANAGAGQLSTGLGDASDGGSQLAAGSNQLYAGLQQLNSRVPALISGVGALDSGAGQLATGMAALDSGLAQYYAGVDALPESVTAQLATNADYQRLLGALQGIIDGIGTKPTVPVADPVTLGQAIRSLEAGLSNPACDVTDPSNPANPCGVKEVVDLIGGKLGDAAADGGDIQSLILASIGSYQQAVSVVPPTTGTPCPQNPAVPVPPVPPPSALVGAGFASNDICVLLSNVVYGLGLPAGVLSPTDEGGLRAQTEAAADGLDQVVAAVGTAGTDDTLLFGLNRVWLGLSNVNCDLGNPTNPANPCGIREVTQLVQQGVPALVDALLLQIEASLKAPLGEPTPGCDPTATLRCASAALTQGARDLAAGTGELNAAAPALGSGVQELTEGGGQLAAGAGDLSSGLQRADDGGRRLAAGISTAADGSEELADGTNRLADGADRLADGLGDAADGSERLADGNARIAAGAGRLADGLGDAADGSGQLSDGLGQAADGTPQIVDGAERLSVEGTSQLIEAGNETALDFGERFATVEAATERARDSGMPYGAPEGATGTAAYSIEIAGADGEGARNLGRGLLALAIFGGVAGVTALARRGV
ncbi:MAG TPA: hypothetical protein VK908_12925 [Jiangellales bacterium]|nr:hypothetical protein [Jiangellales bacterium]